MSQVSTRSHDDVGSTPAVWLVSIALHGLLILLVATNSGSWFGNRGTVGEDDEGDDLRSVGVVLRKSNEQPTEPSDADPSETPSEAPSEATAAANLDGPVVPNAPPVEIDLPRRTSPTIGAGHDTAPPIRAPGDVGDVVRPGPEAFDRGGPIAGLAAGETRFFGIKDKGLRIVYLIDKSGSMGGPKLAAAKTQLLASLETLGEKQQFQVVFYNQGQFPMKLVLPSRDSRQVSLFRAEGVYVARSLNKTLTRQYLGSVRGDEGTDREAALMYGLKYQPDVLYFLTDGDAVELDAAKRSRIKDRNDGRTRIHCIEFGEGPRPTVRTPLKRLAADNEGKYEFVPVGRLAP